MEPKMPTPEEMAKLQKERTKSDANLLDGGAEYKVSDDGKDMRLELTDEQVGEIEAKMEFDMENSVKYRVDKEYFSELTAEQLAEIDEREDDLLQMTSPMLNHLIQQMATLDCGIDGGLEAMREEADAAKASMGGGYEGKGYSVNMGKKGGGGTVKVEGVGDQESL